MKLPRDLSGNDLVRMLSRECKSRAVHQEGSQVILETEEPSQSRMAIPAHKALRVGTLNAILRSVSRHTRLSRDKRLEML